jgi:ubiquinone/menaquinone biosynthesis C-methylase UbiE
MQEFLNPSEVLKEIRLKRNMTAIDFGCGSGGWVIPLAEKLEEGKVMAVDILEEPLSALKARVKLEKISNVEIIRADIEKGTDIFENSADLVLMTNLLFQSENKEKVLEEGKRVLKKGGKILVVDWKKDAVLGPLEKISKEEIKAIAETLKLKIEKEFDAGNFHWGLILKKL